MSDRMRELFDVVSQDPHNAEASQELEQLLRAEASWSELCSLYEFLAKNADDPELAAAYFTEAASLAKDELGDKGKALELYSAALEGAGDESYAVLDQMRNILVEEEAYEDALQVMSAMRERTEDLSARSQLAYEMGRIAEEQLNDHEQAVSCYQTAWEEGNLIEALQANIRIYRAYENYETVAQLLDLELQHNEDPARRFEIYKDLGAILRDHLGDNDQARLCFDQAWQLNPDDDEVADALEQLGGPIDGAAGASANEDEWNAVAGGDAEASAPVAEEKAGESAAEEAPAAADVDESAKVEEAAAAESSESEKVEEAAAAEANDENESDEAAAAEASESNPVEEAAAAEASESNPVEEPANAEASASEEVEEPANEAADEAPAEEAPVSDEAAEFERLAELAVGEERQLYLSQAAAAAKGSEAVRLYLEAVKEDALSLVPYVKCGAKMEADAETYAAIAAGLDALIAEDYDAATGPLTAHRILFGAAHLDEAKTADFKLRELQKKHSDEATMNWQIQRLIETNKWNNIRQLLTDRMGGDPNATRVPVLREMAVLAEERAGDTVKAADSWRQVLQAEKGDPDAILALVRLYKQLEKWPQYADVLKQKVDTLDGDDVQTRLDDLHELVHLYTNYVKQDAQLTALYSEILAIDPDDPEVNAAVIEKYESMRKWPELIAVLQHQAENAIGDDRIALLLRIANIYLDKQHNQNDAVTAFELVLSEDPNCKDALSALDGIYEKRREFDKLVEVRRQLADMADTEEDRFKAYKALAEYAASKIKQPQICRELWEEVLSQNPDDVDALKALVTVYDQAKDFESLTSTIERLVDLIDDNAQRIDLLQRAATTLQDRMGDTARSVEFWQKLLEIDPEHRRAGDSLKKALLELGDWDALTEFFAARDRYDELVRLLEGQVGVQKEDDVRIDLLFRSAAIYRDQLNQQDRVQRAFERVLQFDARNQGAAEALRPIYEEQKDYRKLASVLEILLDHVTEPEERRNLFMQLAQISETSLRNVEGAFDWVRHALQEVPGDKQARSELERLGGIVHQWPTVHDDLVDALARVDDDDSQKDILLCLARILDVQMNDLEGSLARYIDALSIDPECREALDAEEDLFTRMERWNDLLQVLDRKLELASELSEKKALLSKQGEIYENKLEDPISAIDRYRAILEEDENDRDALAALHRLYAAGEAYDDLHEILERELKLASGNVTDDAPEGEAAFGEEAVELRMAIGLVELEHLGQTDEAISCFESILHAIPNHEGARAALEALLEDTDHRKQVSLILEPIYRDFENYESLVVCLEIQVEETSDIEERVALYERIGLLHIEHTGDVARAFDAFARLLREQPENATALRHLNELAASADGYELLADLLEEVVPSVSDEDLAKSLLARLAEIYEQNLGQVDRAIDAHCRILEIDPENSASIEALERLYSLSEQWPELLSIERRKLELTEDPAAKEALQFEIARLLEEKLERPAEAIGVYNEILEHDEQNLQALIALQRLYQHEEQWTELAETIERQLALTESVEEQIALRKRLGQLHVVALGNTAQAIEAYRQILEQNPDDEEALTALEELMAEPDFRATIADILEPIHVKHDDWQKLIEVCEIQREEASEAGRKVALLHRIADLYQNRGDAPDKAFECYARAFAVDPSDEKTLSELHRLAESLGLWEDLVRIYEEQVLNIDDPVVATAVHKRVAAVLLERLGDVENARSHYEAAYEHDDSDLEVISALELIYNHTEQWAELVAVSLRRCELTEEIDEKKALYFRVSELYEEKLGDPERAVEIYQQILELDEKDRGAIDALERIFLHLERFEDLIDVLQKKAALTENLEDRKAIYYVIGATYESELDDLQRAVDVYLEVLNWDENDLTALQSLDRLNVRLEHWDDLLGILEREVALCEDDAERLSLRFRVANLHELYLDHIDTAIDGYASILADCPTHEPTCQALEGLVREDKEALRASQVLEPVFQAQEAWPRMIETWRALLEVTDDLEARTKLRLRIGQAYEDKLSSPADAFTVYGEAFREDPTNGDVHESLERVAQATGSFEPLVQLIEEEIGNLSSEFVERDLLLRTARILEEELGLNAEAIERYRRVMEIDPDHEGAILALDRLYQKEGRFEELAEILKIEVERAEESARIPLLLRLGNLYETALADEIPQALEAYRQILALQAQNPDAVSSLERLFEAGQEQPAIAEILEPIYLENEDWPRLHALLQALLAHEMPGEDRMRGMHRLAELALDKLGDQNLAFDWYGAAFKEVPDNVESREALQRLAAQTGRYADLVQIYTDGTAGSNDFDLKRSINHEIAQIEREKLEMDDAAEAVYKSVLDEIDPNDVESLKGLDELYVAQGRWAELAEILQRETDSVYEPEAQIAFMYRKGNLYEQYLEDIPKAVEQYCAILEQEPLHKDTLDRLEAIYSANEQWEPLFDIFGRKAEIAPDEESKIVLLAHQANLASDFLDRVDDSIGLWNQILEIAPDNVDALVALEILYQGQESWRELVEVCERQLQLCGDDPKRTEELHAKLGRILGDYLNLEQSALDNWNKVLEQEPQNEEALWAVRELYQRIEDLESVAQIDERLLGVLPEDATDQRIELYRQQGEIYQDALSEPQKAIAAWTALMGLLPQDSQAIEALETLYTGEEDWSHCVEILNRKMEITEDQFGRLDLLFRIAEMYEEKLDDANGAKQAYQQVAAIQPDNIDAFQKLEHLYEAGSEWDSLADLLIGRLEYTQDPYERQEIYLKVAKIFEENLGATENAFTVVCSAFEESRDDERFGDELERLAEKSDKWSDLVGVIEGVLEAMGPVPESVALHLRVARIYDQRLGDMPNAGNHYMTIVSQIEPDNLAALTALEELLERVQNWGKVVEVLRQKVALLSDPEERKASFVKMARILEGQLQENDQAIEAYREVLAIDPSDLSVLQALENLYLLNQNWSDLVEILSLEASAEENPTAQIDFYLRIGELWEHQLHDPDRAIDAYNQAIAIDEHCLDALQALEGLYKSKARWFDLLGVYEMMLAAQHDPAVQLQIYGRQAVVQEEKLQDLQSAIDLYRRMVDLVPSDPTAVKALDRIYRQEDRNEELCEVYVQHLAALTDPDEQLRVRMVMGELYRKQEEPAKAIEVLEPVLGIDPQNRTALHTLGELYREVENWPACIEMLSREADLMTDRAENIEQHHQIGLVYSEKLSDYDNAEAQFQIALKTDPTNLTVLSSMEQMYEKKGAWHDVIRTLQSMAEAERSLSQKSADLFRIGQVYVNQLNDRLSGYDYYEQAREADPENPAPAFPLVEAYWQEKDWPRAEPFFDLLVAKHDPEMDVHDLQQLFFRAAYCSEQLYKDEKAFDLYHQAYALDSTHLPTLQGLAGLYYKREEWDNAYKIYQAILVHHRDSLSDAEVVEIFNREGLLKKRANDPRMALDYFRRALNVDPKNRASLEALVDLQTEQGVYEDAVAYRQQLLPLLQDDTERFKQYVAIGDLFFEKLNRNKYAVDAYLHASELQPASKYVLSKLFAIFEASQDWENAAEILLKLSDLEQDPVRKAKYHCAVAKLQRDYIHDSFMAVRSFDKALDAQPDNLEPFLEIDKILTQEKDYERQDRYYRKMLKRATEHKMGEKLIFSLAKNLGEINRSRLKRYEEAIKAYKIALSQRPDDLQTMQIMAELYELNSQPDLAIAQHYKIINSKPDNYESYQQLCRLFMDAQRYDEAWCVCQVLCFFNKASDEERQFFEKYRSRTLVQARKQLDPQHWSVINDKDKSQLLDRLWMCLYRYIAMVMTTEPKRLGLNRKKNLVDPNQDTPFNKVFSYVANETRLQRLDCYQSPQGVPGVRALNLNPPAMMVGPDLLSGARMQEIAFACVKQLYLMGQQHFVATIDETYDNRKARLFTVIYTLTHLVNPQANIPATHFSEDLYKEFQKIPQVELAEMAGLIQKMGANPQQHLDVSKWLEATEKSANRLGLLICNDLQSAVHVLQNEAFQFSHTKTPDRVRELVRFAVSEDYFRLRRDLGLAIGE